ncbi:MAG: sugar ABC transporter permease [Rhodobacterales bacterium]|jgi:D-xylose transport system permease protein|nr:sugar ABC transporter permease [Rhodobacterales bacterium]
MTDTAQSRSAEKPRRSILDTMEIDSRLMGMLGVLVLISLAFQIWTGIRALDTFSWNPFAWLVNGKFLSTQNTYNLAIQTVSIAIMATGMVFIIVTRNIDLAVGSLLALCSGVMAMMQTEILPHWLGLGLGSPLIMPIAVICGMFTGMVIGAFQGWLVGYQGIPSFVVTLGGLLVWSKVAYEIVGGQTIGPLDPTFLMLGGTNGTIGSTASWVLGAVVAVLTVWGIWASRRSKAGHGFQVKPAWAEVFLSLVSVGMIMGIVAQINAYLIPPARLQKMFTERGETMPEGYTQAFGLPISVILLAVVALVMTVVANKTRFGRYVFATGGNPDAAALSGIDTKWLTVKVFALMGVLTAISAAVASARLTNHSLDIGTLDELRVIAAAVIGGTALAGGFGTIYGAVLGALIMQSLQSGMGMVNVDAPYQNIVVGVVLVLAVWLDIVYRKRAGKK